MDFLSVLAIFIAGLFIGLNLYAIIDNYISKRKKKEAIEEIERIFNGDCSNLKYFKEIQHFHPNVDISYKDITYNNDKSLKKEDKEE